MNSYYVCGSRNEQEEEQQQLSCRNPTYSTINERKVNVSIENECEETS